MAIVNIPGGLWIPQWYADASTPPTFDTVRYQLDASGEKNAVVGIAPKTGTLDKFEFLTGAAATPPGNGLKCSFQDVNTATGFPDEAVDQFRVVTGLAANTWTVPGLITSDGTDGGTKRSVTAGDNLCCVIEFESFTAGDNIFIKPLDGPTVALPYNLYPATKLAGAWATASRPQCLVLKYDDGTYEPIIPWGDVPYIPAISLTTLAVSNATNPDRVGLYFSVPFDCEIDGWWFGLDIDGACNIVLDTTPVSGVLKTVSYTASQRFATNWGPNIAMFAPIALTASATYILYAQPTSATAVNMRYFDVSTAAHMGAVPLGTSAYWTQRSAGLFSQTTTRRPWVGLHISGIDSGTPASNIIEMQGGPSIVWPGGVAGY